MKFFKNSAEITKREAIGLLSVGEGFRIYNEHNQYVWFECVPYAFAVVNRFLAYVAIPRSQEVLENMETTVDEIRLVSEGNNATVVVEQAISLMEAYPNTHDIPCVPL